MTASAKLNKEHYGGMRRHAANVRMFVSFPRPPQASLARSTTSSRAIPDFSLKKQGAGGEAGIVHLRRGTCAALTAAVEGSGD